MTYEIVKYANAPKLEKITFLCDIPIRNKLKNVDVINKYFNKANTTCVVGRQGSGKTSILMNFVKIYDKCFGRIYVFMRESSRASLKDNVFEKRLKPERLFEDLTLEDINQVYRELKENTSRGIFSWIIYDDVQDELKNAEIVKVLNKIVANQRHLKCVSFFIMQNFYALSDKIRKLTNNLFLFDLDKKQMEQIFENYIKIDKKIFNDICDDSFKEEHDWMLINITNQKFFNNDFDELKMIV